MRKVARVLEWRGEMKFVTPSRWTLLLQCAAKGRSDMLVLDGQLPEPLPSRGMLVGRFHHRLMELAVTVSTAAALHAKTEEEIAALQQEVTKCPHLRRAGSVSGWHEINASASVAMRVLEARGKGAEGGRIRVENELESKDGLLVGRPDSFSIHAKRAILREYKTGAMRDEKGKPVQAYLDQVTFYAVLIFDNYDVQTVEVSLESLEGDRHEVQIHREQAQEFSQHVISVLTALNERTHAARSLAELAQPSPDSCSYCSSRSICAPFKTSQDDLQLKGEQFLAEGPVEPIGTRSGGALTGISLNDECRKTRLTLLVPTSVASEISPGRRYQLLNLRRRGATFEWGQTSQALSYE